MKKLSLVFLGLVQSSFSLADDNANLYMGARVGIAEFRSHCGGSGCDDPTAAAGLILGYSIDKQLDFETTVDYLGRHTAGYSPLGNVGGELVMISGAPKVNVQLAPDYNVYGKVGLAWWQWSIKQGDVSDVSFLTALGVEREISDNLNLRAEFQYLPNMKSEYGYLEGDSKLFSLGMTYKFGQGSSSQAQESEVLVEEVLEEKGITFEPIVVTLPDRVQSIYFAFNVRSINREQKQDLKTMIEYLSNNPEATAIISGHADSVGSEKVNQLVSYQRALSVFNYLVEQGIEAKRLDVIGLGETEILGEEKSESRDQENRRVDIFSPEITITK